MPPYRARLGAHRHVVGRPFPPRRRRHPERGGSSHRVARRPRRRLRSRRARRPKTPTPCPPGETTGPMRLRFRERGRNGREIRGPVATLRVLAVGSVGRRRSLAAPSSPPSRDGHRHRKMVPTLHRGTLMVIGHGSPSTITVGPNIASHATCLPVPPVDRVSRTCQRTALWSFRPKVTRILRPIPVRSRTSTSPAGRWRPSPYLGLLVLASLLDGTIVAALFGPREEALRCR